VVADQTDRGRLSLQLLAELGADDRPASRRRLKLGLPIGDEYESVAGLMLERLKRIPATGEQVVVEGVVLVATKVNERSIEEVRVRPGRKR
jgi:CBS domain containing-hemolysin-like protein